jgi:alpha-galactosidase
VDDAAEGPGAVVFKIYGDGRKIFDSGKIQSGMAAIPVEVKLRGIQSLVLMVGEAGQGVRFGHANWAEARFEVQGIAPRPTAPPAEEPVMLTPPPPPVPRINGPRVYGCRPGHPFLYRIPCTGQRPIQFSAANLPAGLQLRDGIITGIAPVAGEYRVGLHAQNAHGHATAPFRIVSGDRLALTPPMGWNDWYTHGAKVTEATMREAADALVTSGMADCGYDYCNVDDGWTNGHFPDMGALADYIHARGLKFGIYSSPGPKTCAGFPGSHGREAEHARQFAAWGCDFLKYDFCTYWEVMPGKSTEDFIAPYRLMGRLLREQPRDIVFNLCQYGMANVWEWAAEIGGHCWRTTGDVGMEPNAALPGFYKVALTTAKLAAYAGPGRWNDPDYLMLGKCGDAQYTPNEQYSYMSLWALMAAPLFFSGDMCQLDAFTLNILCNHEILAVNQDELGTQARIVRHTDEELVLAKPLADGRVAVGLFNLGEVTQPVRVTWDELDSCTGILPVQHRRVRDLWRQREVGEHDTGFEASVGRHGVAVVLIG